MPKKVMSGGQTGADQAGLRAAQKMGLDTGGWVPLGFLTECGPDPTLKEYGLVETPTDKYPPRTEANVRDSDGTMRFAVNFNTAGERCTLKAIRWFGKPYFDVDLRKPPPVEEAAAWVVYHKIKVLNVAGNKESTCPGIGALVEDYLSRLFTFLSDQEATVL